MPPREALSIHVPLTAQPAAPRRPSGVERPLYVAEILVLAYEMQRLIDEGGVADRQQMSFIAGFSNSRVSQIMILLELAPDVQEEILFMTSLTGRERISAKAVLPIARLLSWQEQRHAWKELTKKVTHER